MNRNDNTAAQEAEPVGYWVSIPDEPELGHWFSHRPCGEEGYLSLPLYAHPPRPQADAGADAPEGCTPTDARILRKANHDLAAESFELQTVLRGIVDQAGRVLARFDIAAPQAPAANELPGVIHALDCTGENDTAFLRGLASQFPGGPVKDRLLKALDRQDGVPSEDECLEAYHDLTGMHIWSESALGEVIRKMRSWAARWAAPAQEAEAAKKGGAA